MLVRQLLPILQRRRHANAIVRSRSPGMLPVQLLLLMPRAHNRRARAAGVSAAEPAVAPVGTTLAARVFAHVRALERDATVERKYLTLLDVADMGSDCIITITELTSADREGGTREQVEDDLSAAVILRCRVDPEDTEAIDELIKVSEEIRESLEGERMTEATHLRTRNQPLYSPRLLEEQHVFQSVAEFRYHGTGPS